MLPGSETTSNASSSQPQQQQQPQPLLVPERWELVLLADNREKDIVAELQQKKSHILVASRPISIGDFAWMIRILSDIPGVPHKEIMLEYIVERKTIDDMIGSIMDRRYREQKFRLERCLIERRIYLLEGNLPKASSWRPINRHSSSSSSSSSSQLSHGSHTGTPTNDRRSTPWTRTLHKALTSTEQLQGFSIQPCKSLEDSVEFIDGLHKYIHNKYKARIREKNGCASAVLSGRPTFETFQDHSSKSQHLTVADVFAKQLMQVRGASAQRVFAITQLYPTATALVEAFDAKSSTEEKEMLLADIRFGPRMLRIGPSLSRTIYAAFHS